VVLRDVDAVEDEVVVVLAADREAVALEGKTLGLPALLVDYYGQHTPGLPRTGHADSRAWSPARRARSPARSRVSIAPRRTQSPPLASAVVRRQRLELVDAVEGVVESVELAARGLARDRRGDDRPVGPVGTVDAGAPRPARAAPAAGWRP
jgi:hypothetical protein